MIVIEIDALVKAAGVAVLLSAPATVKLKVPADVGIPEITPVLASDNPGGSAPLAMPVNEYGA